jgi:hypothetical protein
MKEKISQKNLRVPTLVRKLLGNYLERNIGYLNSPGTSTSFE